MDYPQFRRILIPLELVPTDRRGPETVEVGGCFILFPSAVRQCIESSVQLAKSGTICLLHATPISVDVAFCSCSERGARPSAASREWDVRARESATSILEELAARFIPTANYEIHVSSGHAVEVILKHAETFRADLIVLATSGRNRTQRFFLGSTTDQLIRYVTCPVIVLPTLSSYRGLPEN